MGRLRLQSLRGLSPVSWALRFLAVCVECEIELQYIDTPFAEDAECSFFNLRRDQLSHVVRFHAARFRHARDLIQRGRRADMWVQPARRGRHQVNRDRSRLLGMRGSECIDSLFDRFQESIIRGPEI